MLFLWAWGLVAAMAKKKGGLQCRTYNEKQTSLHTIDDRVRVTPTFLSVNDRVISYHPILPNCVVSGI